MRISIIGLGYVGCVSAACLANDGNHVIGVDVNDRKVDLINRGMPTIIEKDLDILVKKGLESGRIKATGDCESALWESDVSIICVGSSVIKGR